jgi:hypothetical protein
MVQQTPENNCRQLVWLSLCRQNSVGGNDRHVESESSCNRQLRHAACSLVKVRAIDSVRRLQLSRCLLLSDLVEGSHSKNVPRLLAFLAVLWSSAQRVRRRRLHCKQNAAEKCHSGQVRIHRHQIHQTT